MRDVEEIVSAAGQVPGWTPVDDARELVRACLDLPPSPTIVEVGVYLGRCTVLLAGARRLAGSGVVHCVDPFDCSGDPFSVPYYAQGLAATGMASLHAAFTHNVASLGLAAWTEIHRGTAEEVAREWSEPVDLLLLDADQTPAGARAAYQAWRPFLKEGGTIVLRNTMDREYAPGHDGHRRLVVEEIVAPRYRDIRQVGATTFAIRNAA